MPRLFHISEEKNIETFKPRVSKAIWNFEKYVWAISETYVHNYFLPRDCPRICIRAEDLHFASDDLKITTDKHATSYIFTSHEWQEKIGSTILYQYEFNPAPFEIKDSIAGYYVSARRAGSH